MFIELENATVNTNRIEAFTSGKVFLGSGEMLSITNDDYKKLSNALTPRTRKTKNVEPKNELNELFDKLHVLTGGKGKAVFNLSREKKLNELMTKHRMTEELIVRAATNIGQDKWLQGDNERKKRFGDVDYLLRPDKAAKWSEEQEKKKSGGMFNG